MSFIRSIISSVAEGVIKRISGAGRTGESFTDREYFQHYGFTSRPLSGAEGIFLVQNNNLIAIASDDRRFRIAIENGELALYTDEDKDTSGHRIHFKRNREIEIKCLTKDVDVEGSFTEDIGIDKTETIGGNKSETITGGKTENITLNKAETILGNKTATVTGIITLSATGNVVISGAAINITAVGNCVMTVPGNLTATVTGTANIISADVQLGSAGGPAAARVGDSTSTDGTHPHSHTIAAGSGIVKIG